MADRQIHEEQFLRLGEKIKKYFLYFDCAMTRHHCVHILVDVQQMNKWINQEGVVLNSNTWQLSNSRLISQAQ